MSSRTVAWFSDLLLCLFCFCFFYFQVWWVSELDRFKGLQESKRVHDLELSEKAWKKKIKVKDLFELFHQHTYRTCSPRQSFCKFEKVLQIFRFSTMEFRALNKRKHSCLLQQQIWLASQLQFNWTESRYLPALDAAADAFHWCG